MEHNSTLLIPKTVKQVKPSRRIIRNILDYSRSVMAVSAVYGKAVLVFNN